MIKIKTINSYLELQIGHEAPNVRIENIIYIVATGSDLDYIEKTFLGIKKLNHGNRFIPSSDRSCRWTGDDAKFIVNNW